MSIFDDDHTESVATARPAKKAHKNPFADPEERLEPLMEEGSELDDHELAEEQEEFVPLDRKRNRHLSSSLDNIRDNGPAQPPRAEKPTVEKPKAEKKPAKVAKPAPQTVRNPFADSDSSARKAPPLDNPFLPPTQRSQAEPKTAATTARQAPRDKVLAGERLTIDKPSAKKASTSAESTPAYRPQEEPRQAPQRREARQQDTRQQPVQEKRPQPQPQPTPAPPEFARRQQPSIGVSSLTLWTLLAMAVLLAAWSMIQLSGMKDQLAALNNQVAQMEQPTANGADTNDEARLARLENNYQALESRWQQLPKGSSNTQQQDLAPLQKQLTELQQQQNGLQQQQKALQSAIDALKQQAKTVASTPATSKPVAAPAKPSGWVINIASLSNRDNALKLASKGKALGADTRVESYPSQGRTLYRVRAFGYNSQNAAEQAALRLQTGLGMSGLIVRKVD